MWCVSVHPGSRKCERFRQEGESLPKAIRHAIVACGLPSFSRQAFATIGAWKLPNHTEQFLEFDLSLVNMDMTSMK